MKFNDRTQSSPPRFDCFFCNFPLGSIFFVFLPSHPTSITFSCLGYSTRNHPFPSSLILISWKKKSSARKAIVLTPILSSAKAKKMPNHHLGCGYVDVWSRVMLLQFPSGRFSSFLYYSPFFRSLDIHSTFFRCLPSLSAFPSQNARIFSPRLCRVLDRVRKK